ncbi:MAG: HlyD family efflux transporter periplasmic adaptor subunit [Phyllobacteriaceae bacterium]|nr:HlyD family efflux transporter periplasmic adaptor subunit [Phyllobacteriaceae bacterium]
MAIETARLEQQRATAERLAWKTAQAQRALDNTRVKAPFTGIVQTASAEIGKRVATQDVLATLYAPDALELRFTVTDAQFGRLLSDEQPIIGRPVDVAWDVGATRYAFAGTVTRIGAQLANTTGGAQLIAAIDDASLSADGRAALRPGAFVEIALPEKTYTKAVRLPETALYDQSTLYAVEDGILVPLAAQVLAYDGAFVLVGPEGVAGRTILATRLASIDPGMKVAIEGAEPPAAAVSVSGKP